MCISTKGQKCVELQLPRKTLKKENGDRRDDIRKFAEKDGRRKLAVRCVSLEAGRCDWTVATAHGSVASPGHCVLATVCF